MKLPYFVLRDHIPVGGLRGSSDLSSLLCVFFAYGQAAVLTIGGADRWQGEQFSVHREIPWSPYSWAAMLALSATLLGIGLLLPDTGEGNLSMRGWLIVTGALLCSFWCAYYAWCFYVAAQLEPTEVSLNGPYVWGSFSLWYMIKVGQHLELKFFGGRA